VAERSNAADCKSADL